MLLKNRKNMNKLHIVIISILLILSCMKEPGVETLLILSNEQNPSLQNIEVETGLRYTRKYEDISIQNIFYSESNTDINDYLDKNSGVDLIKTDIYYNFVELYNDKNLEVLPDNIISDIEENYPSSLFNMLKLGNKYVILPYNVGLTHLYIDTTQAKNSKVNYTDETFDILQFINSSDSPILHISTNTDYLRWLEYFNLLMYGEKLTSYDSEKFNMTIKYFTEIYNRGLFTTEKSVFYIYRDNEYTGIDYDIRKSFYRLTNITQDVYFGYLSGYALIRDSEMDILKEYMLHLSSEISEDFYYRRIGKLPLRNDFSESKLISLNKEKYKLLKESKLIFPFLYNNYPGYVIEDFILKNISFNTFLDYNILIIAFSGLSG